MTGKTESAILAGGCFWGMQDFCGAIRAWFRLG